MHDLIINIALYQEPDAEEGEGELPVEKEADDEQRVEQDMGEGVQTE